MIHPTSTFSEVEALAGSGMNKLTLILLLLGLIESAIGESRNLALNHPTKQSSTYSSMVASNAVDGIKTGTSVDSEVSHTNDGVNQWWLVNLQDVYHVRSITVYNKQGHDDLLKDVYFLTSLSDTQDPSIPSALWIEHFFATENIPDNKTITFSPAIPVRYVAIFKKTGNVVLREVEVYGDKAPQDRTNLAIYKTAAQSSDHGPSHAASFAVNGDYTDFTHTLPQRSARWWRVDLGASYEVESVTVYNRNNCCQYRLRNFTISTSVEDGPPNNIDNHICLVQGDPVGDFLYIACERRLARHLVIYSNFFFPTVEDDVLALAEVEIYEHAAPGPTGITVQKWNSTCCNVGWTSITYLSGATYQVKCGNIPWKSVSENSAIVCDASLSGNVACSVRGEITGGFTAQATNVTNCMAPDDPPQNVNLRPINESCVKLNWNKPLHPNGVIIQYNYSCTPGYNGSTMELEATICSLLAGKKVRCTVTACTAAGCGPSDNQTSRTNCTAPSALKLEIVEESDNGFGVYQRLQWDVTWNVEEPNCDSIASVTVDLADSSGSLVNTSKYEEQQQGSTLIKGILAFTNYTVTLTAVNNEKMTGVINITKITRELVPDGPPQNVNMRPINESCVMLNWEKPRCPNGVISQYNYSCTPGYNGSTAELEALVCDLDAGKSVRCAVTACTTAGCGPSDNWTLRTNCTAPSALKLNITKECDYKFGDYQRLQWNVTWNVKEPNCDSIAFITVDVTDSSGNLVNTSTIEQQAQGSMLITGILAFTNYTVTLTAANNENMRSVINITKFTKELAPDDPPQNVNMRPINESCVKLRWDGSLHPNGVINQYNYSCTPGCNGSTAELEALVCGLDAGKSVRCAVSACTTSGCGPTANQTERTNCTAPSALKLEIMEESGYKFGVYQRLQWNVTWKVEEPNCDSIAFITINVTTGSGSLVNTSRIENKPHGSMVIEGILAFTNYTVTLTAVNSENMTSVSSITNLTRELAPDDPPQNVNMRPINESCVKVNWDEPLYPNGVINQYNYSCTPGCNGSTEKLEVTVCGLDTGKSVRCTITACTTAGCGSSANHTARTNCAAPSALKLDIMEETDYKVGVHQRLQWNVTWNVEEANCDSITFIRVELTNGSGSLVDTSTIKEKPQGSMLIDGILAFTYYTVTLTAVNNENIQNQTSTTRFTRELAPDDEPRDVTVIPINGSCVTLGWLQPGYPNGNISYYNATCNCINNTYQTEQPPDKLEHELCGLPSGQKVHCSVQSKTGGGYGPAGNGSGFTHLEVKSLPRPEIMNDANKVTLRKAELISKVDIAAYHVVIRSRSPAASRSKRESVQENKMLLDYEEAKRLKLSEYITAAIKPTEFTNDKYELELGDNKVYNKYLNARLDLPEYTVRTGVCVELEADRVYVTNCTYSPEVYFKVSDNNGMIIGASVAGLVLLILAIVGLVFFMRRRSKHIKETDAVELSTVDKNMKRLNSATNASQNVSSVRKYEELQTSLQNASNQKERYDQLTLSSKSDNVGEPDEKEAVTYERVSECIPLDRLEAYVESGERRILSQYKVLPDKPSGEMIFACIPENRGKSRYKGLYPVDEFRVRLLEPAPSRTDFINASFIEGVSEDKAYIAAQGPMASTLDDFWHMIWQEKPSAIVMVTKCWEDGKAKCEQYWPEKQGSVMEFGNITVQLSSEELWASFGMRSLKVTKAGTSFTFKQFQYFGWPDHGVPVEIASFVTFYRKVKAYSKMIKKALVVHCSAGVGRTGTFIAMDYLLNQATAFNMVDPFECVMAMRKRRPSMIQTKEQYLFLHKVVLEALSTEKFRCNPVELGKRVAAFGSSLEIDMITQEFQHIEMMVEKTEMQFEAGKLLSNKGRNRIEDILPHDAYRPFLTGTNGDYINAVFVNSHKEKEKMVATQLPLVNTVQDFWQLIHDQKSVTIIQLRAADEPYYPEQNRTMKLKSGLLSNTGIETQDHFQLVHLTQKTAENSEKKILLYQFFGWKSKYLPDTDSFLALFQHLQKYQQQTDSHKIIVTCGDGATRSGMFICAFNVIERLRMEQEVDVYNEVLLARLRRPQFVSTSQQYLSLYKILNKYVDGFSEYSNFT